MNTTMTTASKIEVLPSVERRRRWSVEEKIRLIEESNRPGMSVSYVARKHGIPASQLLTWRRRMAEGSREAIRADDEVVSAAEVRELKRQVREVQRVLGKKTMETRFSAMPSRSLTKKLISQLPPLPGDDTP